MIDSRLDRIAEFVSDAEIETDQLVQRLLVNDALREYMEFADEFSASDSEVNIVTFRLMLAAWFVAFGDWRSASASLRLAREEIQVVKNR